MPRILSVDDSSITLGILNRALKTMVSCPVESVDNGQKAVDYVNAVDGDVALIIMDIQMPPGIDGYAAAANIRKKYPKIPILSYSSLLASIIRATSKDFDEWLDKAPFNAHQLHALLKKFVPTLLIAHSVEDEKSPAKSPTTGIFFSQSPFINDHKNGGLKEQNNPKKTHIFALSTPTRTRRMTAPCSAEYQRLAWLISPFFHTRRLPLADSIEARTHPMQLVRAQ